PSSSTASSKSLPYPSVLLSRSCAFSNFVFFISNHLVPVVFQPLHESFLLFYHNLPAIGNKKIHAVLCHGMGHTPCPKSLRTAHQPKHFIQPIRHCSRRFF